MITIGGIDYTDNVNQGNLNCFKKKTTMNDNGIELHSTVALPIKVGQELLFTIGTDLEFGGIVQTIEATHWSNYIVYDVYATAYEQITDRRTVVVDYINLSAGYAVNDMVNTLASDGITVGVIDTGATITYAKNAVSVREVLDEMARASGYVWYINDNRELFFQSDYVFNDGGTLPNDYALTGSNQTLKSYYNKVFTLGAKDEDGLQIVGQASDIVEQARMATLYGSGVYGTVIRSSVTTSDSEANTLSSNELLRRSYEHDGIVIESRTKLTVGDFYLGVTIPEAFISNQNYVIDEVRIRGNNGSGYIYNARLVAYSTAIVTYDERWQEKFKQLMNVNDESTAINSSIILAQRVFAEELLSYNFVLDNYSITDELIADTQTPTPVGPSESINYGTLLNSYLTGITDTATATTT